MKQPTKFLKVAVLTSSILLVGGFILYGTAAFGWIMGTRPAPTAPAYMGGSKFKILVDPASPQAVSSELITIKLPDAHPVFMYSSKSIILPGPAASTTSEPAASSTPEPTAPAP